MLRPDGHIERNRQTGASTRPACATLLGLSRARLERELANARMRPRAPRLIMNYISKEDKLRFDECNFRGSIPFTAPSAGIPAKWAATCWGM